jgi:hypothetical protein
MATIIVDLGARHILVATKPKRAIVNRFDFSTIAIGRGDKMKTKFTSSLFGKGMLYFLLFIICHVSFLSVHTASSDALDNWHQRGAGVTTEYLQGIVYGNGTFIAVGRNGAIVSSADGVIWESINSGTTKWLKAIMYSNQNFKAVGWDGVYLTSADGRQWNVQVMATVNDYHNDIIFAGGLYIVVGYFNDIAPRGNVISSLDGINWNVDTMFAGYNYGIAHGANTYIVTGNSGKILSSPDCDIWTKETSGSNSNLISVCYANNLFVVVGTNGVILSSIDGLNWSTVGAVTPETLYEVRYYQDTWIAVGANGTLLTSKSGDNWEMRNSNTNSDLRSIAFGENTVVAVGENGLILQSDSLDPNNGSQQQDGDGGDGGSSCFTGTLTY